MPSVGRSDLLDPVIPPEAAHATKSWNAAFCTHSCSDKNEDAVSGGNREHQWKVYRDEGFRRQSFLLENFRPTPPALFTIGSPKKIVGLTFGGGGDYQTRESLDACAAREKDRALFLGRG